MPRRRDEEPTIEDVLPDEGFVRGTVKKLFETGVGVPLSARAYLLEQIAGWKTDFLTIFQSEIRRFLDRQNPSEELRKLIAGHKLELSVTMRMVPDDGTTSAAGGGPGSGRTAGAKKKTAASARKAKSRPK